MVVVTLSWVLEGRCPKLNAERHEGGTNIDIMKLHVWYEVVQTNGQCRMEKRL